MDNRLSFIIETLAAMQESKRPELFDVIKAIYPKEQPWSETAVESGIHLKGTGLFRASKAEREIKDYLAVNTISQFLIPNKKLQTVAYDILYKLKSDFTQYLLGCYRVNGTISYLQLKVYCKDNGCFLTLEEAEKLFTSIEVKNARQMLNDYARCFDLYPIATRETLVNFYNRATEALNDGISGAAEVYLQMKRNSDGIIPETLILKVLDNYGDESTDGFSWFGAWMEAVREPESRQ